MFVRRTVYLVPNCTNLIRPSCRLFAKRSGYDSADYEIQVSLETDAPSMPRLEDLPVEEDEQFSLDVGNIPIDDNDPEAKVISSLLQKVAYFDAKQKKKFEKLGKQYDEETLQTEQYINEIKDMEKEAEERRKKASVSAEQQAKVKLETAKFLARRLRKHQTPDKPEEPKKQETEPVDSDEIVESESEKLQPPRELYEELDIPEPVSTTQSKTDRPSDIVQRIFGTEQKKSEPEGIPQDRKKTVAFKVTLDQIPTVMHSSHNWVNAYQQTLATKPTPHKEFAQSFYLIKN